MTLGLEELGTFAFWRAALAELVGTFFFAFLGLLSTTAFPGFATGDIVRIGLAFGLAIATMVHCTAHISGGHLNPAVTIGFLSVCKIPLARAILYVVMQCIGAIAGAGLVYAFTPRGLNDLVGPTTPFSNSDMTVDGWQAFMIELFLTAQLVLTVFATVDPNRKDLNGSGPLAIGLAVALGHFAAIPYTGASMNPARSFGSAVVGGEWTDHWVYWIGPILGGILAAIVYNFILDPTSSKNRIRNWCSPVLENEPNGDLKMSSIEQNQNQAGEP
ncbi:aquaporin-like [Anneissia japonica]|uniref:aquaporin-like n=1 Tax=Anneissia japonica TaxID=1529436 RepID=UPI001425929C|nr:aquaporin-like [Anneissia japonica]